MWSPYLVILCIAAFPTDITTFAISDNVVIELHRKTTLIPPTIDINPLIHLLEASEEEVSNATFHIGKAAREWGFFNVMNHGIESNLIDQMFSEMNLFFHSSNETKYSVSRGANNSRGFTSSEFTKRIKDEKEVFDVGPLKSFQYNISSKAKDDEAIDGYNLWPKDENFQSFRTVVESYYNACEKLSSIVLRAMINSLNCKGDSVTETILDSFQCHSSFLRLNYYPVVHNDQQSLENNNSTSKKLGISRHTDAGAITILLQDPFVSSLEVYSGSKEELQDGEWIPVDPIPHTLTINTGDMLQVWTNDMVRAPEHRVRASLTQSRYSAPFFYNPSYDTIVEPVTIDCLDGMETPEETTIQSHYRPIRWGDFRTQRFRGDYCDVGEEIQIEHFRI